MSGISAPLGRAWPRTLVAVTWLLTARAATAQTLLVTATTVEDLAWSAATSRLYAVLPPGVGGPESGVAELNPATGAIVTRVAIASGANGGATQLAVSDDGSTLYVGVDGGRRVRRYVLPAMTAGPEFPIDAAPPTTSSVVRDLAAVPGTTSAILVAQAAPSAAGQLVVYDDGVPRPDRGAGLAPVFVSATQVLDRAYMLRYRLTATGVTADSPADERLSLPVSTVEGGVVYAATGEVFDLLSRRVRGRCRAQGIVVPAPDLDRLFYFAPGVVSACAPSTYVLAGQLSISSNQYQYAVRTGRGRAALLENSGRLAIALGFDAALPPPPPPSGGTPWPVFVEPDITASLTGCTTCRPGDTFRLVGTASAIGRPVEVKAAIILPGGAAIAATTLGVSHLVLRNVYPPASATILEAVIPAGLPPGRWLAELALVDPDSGAVWSRSTVPFEVQP